MYFKYVVSIFLLSIILPTSAQTFDANNFSDLQSALTTAKSAPNENHLININGNIQFTSAISEALNLELLGSDSTTPFEFDLNGFKLTLLGTNKSSKLSNLNIIENLKDSRIVSRCQTLTIDKSTLTGHSVWGNELVKSSDGALIVNESRFLNNNSGNGAGIYFSGNSASINNSEFSGNKGAYGGAIYVDKGNFNIANSKLNNNQSTAGGGALYVKSGATAILDNTGFDSNKVTTASTGGAIYNNGNLTIKNGSSFTNNEVASGSGGAISNSGTLNIDSATFENNTAKQDGGAIADTGSSTIIKNSNFINNKSLEYIGIDQETIDISYNNFEL